MTACVIDWAAVAAWVQATGALLAIGYTVWQGKANLRREKEKNTQDLKDRQHIALQLLIVQIERFVSAMRCKHNKVGSVSESKALATMHEWPESELLSLFSIPESVALFDQLPQVTLLGAKISDRFGKYLRSINRLEHDLAPIAVAYYITKSPERYLEDLFRSAEAGFKSLSREGEALARSFREMAETITKGEVTPYAALPRKRWSFLGGSLLSSSRR